MTETILMTQAGLDELRREKRRLLDEEQPRVKEALKAARDQGDLSENADYDAARTLQAQIEARIAEIEHIEENARVVEPGATISIGYQVHYREVETGEEHQILFVGSVESDPLAEPFPKISSESPLGKALAGHKDGDVVLVASARPSKCVSVAGAAK